MTSFEFLTVALSFVLGLAVTVLLTSLLAAFRARRTTRMSWVALAWAGYILVLEFDIWWELYGLASMQRWTIGAFVMLLVIALLLFAAGGLVLPSAVGDYPDDLEEYFQQDGRWAVVLVAALYVVGSIANVALFEMAPLGIINLFNALGIVVLGTVAGVRNKAIQRTATILFGVWLGVYLWVFVPGSY
jgi:hypothetical protein